MQLAKTRVCHVRVLSVLRVGVQTANQRKRTISGVVRCWISHLSVWGRLHGNLWTKLKSWNLSKTVALAGAVKVCFPCSVTSSDCVRVMGISFKRYYWFSRQLVRPNGNDLHNLLSSAIIVMCWGFQATKMLRQGKTLFCCVMHGHRCCEMHFTFERTHEGLLS